MSVEILDCWGIIVVYPKTNYDTLSDADYLYYYLLNLMCILCASGFSSLHTLVDNYQAYKTEGKPYLQYG